MSSNNDRRIDNKNLTSSGCTGDNLPFLLIFAIVKIIQPLLSDKLKKAYSTTLNRVFHPPKPMPLDCVIIQDWPPEDEKLRRSHFSTADHLHLRTVAKAVQTVPYPVIFELILRIFFFCEASRVWTETLTAIPTF